MENLGRYLFLGSLLSAVFLGYRVSSRFGFELGMGVIAFLCIGGVALILVMSGNNLIEDDYAMDEFGDDSAEYLSGQPGSPRQSGNPS
ncbi:MAG: hypothetical protein GX751_08965 [Desulfuromonadaceae bacterium]|nr:hypothetical protein [Desulfuromonadaceae bacterium]